MAGATGCAPLFPSSSSFHGCLNVILELVSLSNIDVALLCPLSAMFSSLYMPLEQDRQTEW
jgi:hypothetical protein